MFIRSPFHAGPVSGSLIANALRLNDDDNAYLHRTPSSAGNRKTWTYAVWFKRGDIDAYMYLLSAHQDANNYEYVRIANSGAGTPYVLDYVVRVSGTEQVVRRTNAVFRDPSAWYHVVIAVDQTQATANDRAKIWINGVQVTSFAAQNDFAQNTDFNINSTGIHEIGKRAGFSQYTDGLIALPILVDGTALDDASFAEFDGIWYNPKDFSGSHGTNGFQLDFADSADFGNDVSGNGNDFTSSGLTTSDQLTDTPSDSVDNGYGNFCTWNTNAKEAAITLSEGNTSVSGGDGNDNAVYSTLAASAGKFFAAFRMPQISSNWRYGLADAEQTDVNGTSTALHNSYANVWDAYFDSGTAFKAKSNNTIRSLTAGATAVANTDWMCVAFDATNKKLWLGWYDVSAGSFEWAGSSTTMDGDPVNGTDQTYSITGEAWRFMMEIASSPSGTSLGDFGQGVFPGTIPSGFKWLATQNMDAPAITDPSEHFTTVLDTGANIKSASESEFTYQLAIIKDRDNTNNWQWIDSVRGTSNVLQSNTETSDTTYAAPSGNSVAWVWNLTEAASSNTDGSLTSNVAANIVAGVSAVAWTNHAGAGTSTIGHGLDSAPELIVSKDRDNSGLYWLIYHKDLAATQALRFTTGAPFTIEAYNQAHPTATTFATKDQDLASYSNDVISYCFHSVRGFSKIGSFSAGGTTDDVFIPLDFLAGFFMYKLDGGGQNCVILDTARHPGNPIDTGIYPNASDAETSVTIADINLNGVKIRNSALNGDYIFAAFAAVPIQGGVNAHEQGRAR